MSNLNKLNFTTLEVPRRKLHSNLNKLKWVQDVKLHPTVKNLRPAIKDKTDNLVGEAEKATTMIFIRRHIHMHCKPSTLLMKIHEHFGSLWLIVLITKKTSSFLKQDMIGSICTSKTLSL
ncbi:hypothetical protein ACFX10_031952 [Malus domestica]